MYLETKRLVLRRFREEDFQDFCRLAIDEEACRMMGRDNIRDAATARPTFDWLKDREEGGYALVYRETGEVIGNLTVCAVPPEVAQQEELRGLTGRALSFSMGRDWRRMGLMEEAVRGVVRRLFEEGVDYVNCGHFDFNLPSRELQKKLGFTHLLTQTVPYGDGEVSCVENILRRN